jgi:hypothetical protein
VTQVLVDRSGKGFAAAAEKPRGAIDAKHK